MTDFDAVDYFTDTAVGREPIQFLTDLREQCPVARLPHHGVVAVTGFEEAIEVWKDNETFSSCNSVTGPFPGLPPMPAGGDLDAFIAEHRGGLPMAEYLVAMDPPSHTATRGLLMRLLTPSRLKENEEFIWRLADAQLDDVIGQGPFEMFGEFAQPLAVLVIADLLGVPESAQRGFRAKLAHAPRARDSAGNEAPIPTDPLGFVFDTFSAYVEDRRREPQDDVLTQLALATYPDGSQPDVADVARTAAFLFAAGQDTTARLVTTAVQILGDDLDLQEQVRRSPERIPHLIEEVLRLAGPVQTISRLARTDTTIGGVEIPAGTTVAIFPHAANRDPRHFTDPDGFQLDRPNARSHLAFGRGIHTCPGGPLARVEARIALERLLTRSSRITIDEAVHGPAGERNYRYEPGYILYGVRRLQVEISPA